jgi:hypothetical protein
MKVFPGKANSIISLRKIFETLTTAKQLIFTLAIISPQALFHSQSTPPPPDEPSISTPPN